MFYKELPGYLFDVLVCALLLASFGLLRVPKIVFAQYCTVKTRSTDRIVHTETVMKAL